MAGKNSGVCHSCRGIGHFFDQCQRKRRCPNCKTRFRKCFEVEKETTNKGKLFKCCNEKCGFWQWVEKGKSCATAAERPIAVEAVPEITQLFQFTLQLNEDEELRISLHMDVTMMKTKSKGKGRHE